MAEDGGARAAPGAGGDGGGDAPLTLVLIFSVLIIFSSLVQVALLSDNKREGISELMRAMDEMKKAAKVDLCHLEFVLSPVTGAKSFPQFTLVPFNMENTAPSDQRVPITEVPPVPASAIPLDTVSIFGCG